MDYVLCILAILNAMSPYLLFGFFIAGVLHVYVPHSFFKRHLSAPSFGSVLKATLIGIPLPLCSCGTIPVAMSLKRDGASRGATVAFLIATPQTGVDSIMATYSLMGLPFAILRPLAALVTALLGGAFTNHYAPKEEASLKEINLSNESQERSFKAVIRYAFYEILQNIGRYLTVGLILAAAITVLVPEGAFDSFSNYPVLNMLVIVALSVPMYLCATGSIPIAAALMLKGLSAGSALVLLMAGPAASIASIAIVGKVLGKKTLMLYLIAIVAGSMLFGLGVDYLLPKELFVGSLNHLNHSHHQFSIIETVSSIAFVILLINALIKRKQTKEISMDNKTLFSVKGMNCNHCRESVIKAISKLQNVESVEVSLEDGTAYVAGDVSADEVCNAVKEIGFECEKK